MPTDAVDLDAARRLIEQTAGRLGFDDSAIWDMKCAATEALTNALDHGAPSDDGKIHLRLGRDHGDMLLEVWGGGRANGRAPRRRHPPRPRDRDHDRAYGRRRAAPKQRRHRRPPAQAAADRAAP